MSAETSRDVSLIQDEDVLRKMWQDTEDFGRKKEIRAHMYKLREARLRDFYNTGEVTSETKQTTTTIKESSTSKGGCELPTHADSLADHSFLSLKTKEIRDSESPTRDVAYKISGGPSRLVDQGWNIVSSNESSADGKTHSTTRLATTSGTEPIEGGLSKYAAKTEQKATVYRDGDDKNYVKSVGANTQSLIKQEATGGDENNRFYTTSTSTSSSSKYTSEQKSASGDPHSFPEHRSLEDSDVGKFSRTNQTSSRNITQRQATSEDVDFEFAPKSTTSTTVVRKTYTTDVPDELKQHPSYVDGKSKVITETKTLPDGSTMTTTRYETKGGKTTTSSTSSQSYSTSSRHVSNEQKSSSDNSSSSKTDTFRSVKDSRVSGNNEDAVIKYVVPDTPDTTDSKITISTKNQDVISSKNQDRNFSTSTSTTTSSVKVIKNQDVVSDSKTVNVNIEQGNFTDDKEIKRIEDTKLIGRDVHKDTTKRIVTDDFPNQNVDTKSTHREQIIIIPSEQLMDRPGNQTTRTVKTTVIKTIGTKQDNQKAASDDFINVERQRNITEQTKIIPTQTIETVEYVKPSESNTPLPEYETEVEKEPIKRRPIESEPTKFESPERRQPIKPGKSELDDKPVPTEGQYDTTYRTDYVNRRISVEVSPTHDAFARSLRAVSPERESKIGSTRSLRTNSSNSLRNSTSPEKYIDRRQPSGLSPDARPCRPVSPSKKSPSGKTGPDKQTTVTRASNRYDSNTTDVTRKRKDDVIVNTTVIRNVPDRKSPERKPYNTDTLTRRKKITDDSSTKITTEETVDSNTLTRRTPKPTKQRSRSNSPTSTASDIEFIRNTDIVTDLDVDDATTINTATTRTSRKQTKDVLMTEKRPSTLDITTTNVTKTVTDRSSASPLPSPRKQTPSPVKEIAKIPRHQSPNKEPDASSERPPKDKVFKRTDTYEERCRQILGISDKKTITDISVTTKKTERPKSPEKKPSSPATSPTKESPRKPALPNAARRPVSKSPEKLSSPIKIQEFPSQVRKSPEKQPPEKYSEKTKPVRESPKIQEFPSQIRKSPEKQPLEKSQRKPKPVKDAAKIHEFPSQTGESPEKLFDRPDKPQDKSARPNEPSKTKEFPLQIRRSPECVSLDDLPINRNAYCEGPGNRRKETVPSINDFPSQIRRTPQKESLEQYPEKSKPTKAAPNINEFPSQIRKSHEKHPLDEYPEKPKPEKVVPKISEFPSQIRKTPERELMEQNMGEKMKQVQTAPTVNEFPAQVRKSPEKQTLEEYPEKPKQTKTVPTINEFPSQIRKSPEKEPLEEYPAKSKPTKTAPNINEFPSQVRKYPEEPLEDYPEKTKPTKEALLISEFPSQIKKLPVKQPLEDYPEKAKPSKVSPSVNEFPSQIRKSPEKIPVDEYPGKGKPCNISPSSLEEFPSQGRKPPQKQPLEKQDKTKERVDAFIETERLDTNIKTANILRNEFTDVRTSETVDHKKSADVFLNKGRTDVTTTITTTAKKGNKHKPPRIDGEDSESTTEDEEEELHNEEDYIVTETIETDVVKRTPSVRESPEKHFMRPIVTETVEIDIVEKTAPVKKFLEKDTKKPAPTQPLPKEQQKELQKPKATKTTSQIQEFPSQVKKSPLKEKPQSPPEKQRPRKDASTVHEFPSQIRKAHQRETLEPYPEKVKPTKDELKIKEFPSQIRKQPGKQAPYPERTRPGKEEAPNQIRKTTVTEQKPHEPEEELIRVIHTTGLETRVPIEEVLVTKKFIDVLCQEEETDRRLTQTDETTHTETVTAKRTHPVRNVPSTDVKPHKTVKKDFPGKYAPISKISDRKEASINLIKKERIDTDVSVTKTKKDVAKSSPKALSPIKKSPDQTSVKRKTITKTTQHETKFTGVSEYTDEYCKVTTIKDGRIKQAPTDRNVKKITTVTRKPKKDDVDNFSETEEEIRTKPQKTTPTYTTRATKVIQNGEMPKTVVLTITHGKQKPKEMPKTHKTPGKETPKRPTSPTKKLEEIRQPKQTDTRTTELDKSIYNAQQTRKTVTKVTEIKQARPLTKTVHKTFEIQSPKRHVVSTIINIKPKAKPESTPVKKAIEKTKITKVSPKSTLTTKPSKQTNRAKPIQNGHIPTDDETEESDTEEVEQMEETHITKATVRTQRTDTTQTKDKITRTVSDHVIKAPRKTPVRGASKPELISKPDEPIDKRQKPEKNIITTKSILIENAVADEREIIVDLKRSKSSREETPDRTGPYPVPTNEDSGVPRYPDHITEPEDVRRSAPKRLSDIPLTESENVTEFTRITEVTRDQNQRIDKTVKEETDERLLSVNEKINIYLSQTDKKPKDMPKTSQKSERPKYDVDLEDDECLLSVSDKVNKFITTAEQLTVKDIPQRPKSPKLQNVEDEIVSRVSEKVSRFTEKVQQPVKPPKDGFAPKISRPDLSKIDESIRSDECLLSVSDKVTKFISTAEKLTTPDYKKPPVSLSKLEPVGKRSPSPRKDILTECAIVETDDETYIRRSISPEKLFSRDSPKQQSPSRKSLEPSPTRQISESPKRETPERRPSNTYARKPSDDIIKPRRDSFEPSDTPKSSRRTSQDEPKTVLSPTGRLRSTETIRKAKALFENMTTEQEIPKQRDILMRPSVFEGRKTKKPETDLAPKTKLKEEIISEVEKRKTDTRRKDVCTKLTYDEDDEVVGTTKTFIRKTKLDAEDGLKSTRLVIEGLKSPTSPERAPEIHRPKQPRSRSSTPEGDVPHYMLPLDRTVRERSPHYENIKQLEEAMTRSTTSEQYEEVDAKATKFGVTLRRTDSGRVITTRRKSSTASVEKLTGELDVESIYDLHVLESLLERVVGYDIRRRIRAQIRIVKRLIEEDKLESVVIKMTKKSTSPVRDVPRRSAETSPVKYTSKPQEIQVTHAKKPTPENKFYQHSEIITESGTVEKSSEYRSSYEFSERRTSSEMKTERRSASPETKTIIRSSSPDYKAVRNSSPDSKRSESPGKSRLSPEKRSTQTETTRVFQTELKKMKPISKTVVSEKPEWATQRTLRKVSETSPPIKRTVTTTKTASTTRKENRSSSPPKGTDVITSSYGVGPIDENGSPLFGLKALRAQNKSEKTKVQGTVIRSHYYAENGQEPVGEISVTKYSTDPKDLDAKNLVSDEKGITSVTTTQKFGYKGTPALKSIGSKKKQITNVDDEILTSTKTSEKVTRRGSVKEMSQKFIENAVETSKNERQSSYPKAGLILRTSSFRDAASSGTGSSREGSPGMQEICETVTTAKTSKSGDTFLTNKSRVTGVQDVIIRMKNEDVEIGEIQEDAEARNLLNKFIGAQVILSGMESHVTRPSSTVRTTTTKVTTTSDGGKPKTVTRTFTQPITEELLETIWDQQTLQLLLEQSTDYEDRRIIRARLRQVMAEQEACAELVEKASEECEKKDSGSIQGESLLLPLLQGLLDAPETEQTADSGTESGEDLRNGLILEVQNALCKLSTSLKSDSSDVSSERRDSLLQLISRLQIGLSTQISPSSSSERRASLQTRFGKRKQRANRHTVGVTTEELEDARRLMQEIALRDNLLTTCAAMPPECGPLQKQHSEGSVLQTQPFKKLKHQKIKPVKNLTAKPFISSTNTSQSQSGTSSTVDTPTETSESLDFLTSSPEKSQTDIPQHEAPQVVLRDKKPQYAKYHQSMSFEPEKPPVTQRRPLSEAVSLDYSREIDLKSVQKAVTQAAAIKQLSQLKSDVSEGTQDSETDDDPVTVKVISHQPEIIDKPQIQDVSIVHDPPVQPQPDLLLQTNPVYQQPDDSDTENDDCSSQYNEKANRFNSKKLKMKRANTIDIPKPLKYYECDDDESEGEHDLNARRNSYLALRGPISIGKFNTGKKVPEFQPKTDSDHKFVAFLNKHNENADPTSKASIWAKQQKKNNSNNWTNKFGNIKTAFEKIGDEKSSSASSARDFWKSADDAMSAGKVSHIGPKISRQSARNLQQMFEEKQKQTQRTTPWSTTSNNINIVTGSLKVDTKAFEGSKSMKVVTQPNSVNKFSHAPISAFKPVPKKADLPFNHVQNQTQTAQERPIKTHNLNIPSNTHNVADKEDATESSDSPLFLYSPKPLSPENVVTSPALNSAPWGNRGGESRVLSIAASKFQNKVAPEQNKLSQRRPSREKISIPSALQHVPQPEKLTAPYLVKSLGQGNSVKKLSGQYDNIEAKNASKYSQPPSFLRYNQTPQTQRPLSNQFSQNQNYTIYYRQPQNNPPYNNELSKAHPFSAQSNVQRFVPQTYQNHGGYSDRNDLGRAQANTFQADVAVHQRQYNQCQNVSQQRHSQPQIYQSHFTEQHENSQSEPQYTSSCQFKPQRSIQPNYVSNTNQFYTPHEHYVETPSQPHVSHHQSSPSQQFTSHPELAYSDKLPKQPLESHESVHSERVDLQKKQTPSEPLTIFDYPSPPLSPRNRPKYEKQTSQESLTEYTAVSSKIMSGPVSQQAVTVQQNSPKNRNQHDMDAALNLKTSLEKISKVEQRSSSERKHSLSSQSFKIKAPIEKSKENNAPAGGHIVYNNVSRCPRSQNKPAPPDFYVNDKPVSLESFEINERGESVLTSKFHIPVKAADQDVTPGQVLSRSESWHQICRGGSLQTNKPSPKASKSVSRSKSSHTLALPKQFEAGMTKSEMLEKKRSIEAYFGEIGKVETKKSSINRVKTSQKISTQRQNSENVTTHKSFSEGPVTTTQVTTKVTSQQQVTKKPLSPFAKFKQLDKQNSLNSPPSTPKTPTGGGPLFKFTDPALSRSASTVKERLLQWCQMKTKEYENIQLDNFSTSWADGLAFCALIHHFLPDAFEYHALNPKNRRHNFTLAFQVADEKADIAPLLDVDDMVATRKPDWKCVFTYVQSIYRRFKDED